MAAHPPRLARSTGGWPTPAVELPDMASGNWPLLPDTGSAGWACPPPITTRTPVGHADSVRAARDFTVVTLQRWGVTERSEDIPVVVSELLTNALQHAQPPAASRARWPIRLGLLHPGPCVLCAVADPSEVAPAPKAPGYLAETGRGLHIICALSDTWGYTLRRGMGKVVWALFATTNWPSQ